MRPGGLFGADGRRRLDAEQDTLFPPTVRPVFLRLLWAVLVVLAAVATLLAIHAGRLT